MTIGDICSRTVIIGSRETSLCEGASLMRERHVGDIVVAELIDGKWIPAGIVTDRDIDRKSTRLNSSH